MFDSICKMLIAVGRQRSEIADSVKDDPKSWTFTPYRATHTSGVSVWIANSVYGLHVELLSKQWKPSWAERHLIYTAFKHGRARQAERTRREIEAEIKKQLET